MIDLNDVLFVAGLAAACTGAYFALGWSGVAVVVGVAVMAFGVLRQMPRRG